MKTYLYEVKFYIDEGIFPVEDIVEVTADTKEVADNRMPFVVDDYLLSKWGEHLIEEVTYIDCAE